MSNNFTFSKTQSALSSVPRASSFCSSPVSKHSILLSDDIEINMSEALRSGWCFRAPMSSGEITMGSFFNCSVRFCNTSVSGVLARKLRDLVVHLFCLVSRNSEPCVVQMLLYGISTS